MKDSKALALVAYHYADVEYNLLGNVLDLELDVEDGTQSDHLRVYLQLPQGFVGALGELLSQGTPF